MNSIRLTSHLIKYSRTMTLAESTVQVFGSSSIQQSLLAQRLRILEQTLQEVNIIVESLDPEKNQNYLR